MVITQIVYNLKNIKPVTVLLTHLLKKMDLMKKFPIDNTLNSLFGVSKLSADILTQEYGKYFGMKTVSFRGGCLTGGGHAGTMLHGFLSYLMKCVMYEKKYKIFGYKGKQVRETIYTHLT